jgi:hypothetical protein
VRGLLIAEPRETPRLKQHDAVKPHAARRSAERQCRDTWRKTLAIKTRRTLHTFACYFYLDSPSCVRRRDHTQANAFLSPRVRKISAVFDGGFARSGRKGKVGILRLPEQHSSTL